MTTYTVEDCRQFVEDMEEAGIETEHYRGRYFWQGPAARTDEDGWPSLQDVIRATKVPLQWDNLARDWIVYPKVGDPGHEDEDDREDEDAGRDVKEGREGLPEFNGAFG